VIVEDFLFQKVIKVLKKVVGWREV